MKKIILFLLILGTTAQAQDFKFPVDTLLKSGPIDNRINILILGDGFTEAEMPKFIEEANKFKTKFLRSPAYARCQNYFNFFAVKTPSKQSGATNLGRSPDFNNKQGIHQGQPIETKDTFFGSAFGTSDVHRLVGPTEDKYPIVAKVIAYSFPASDLTMMIVNTPWYGGAGGSFSVYTLSPSAMDVAIHEIGHTFTYLADEYWISLNFSGERINRTAVNNSDKVKWKNWLEIEKIGIYNHVGSDAKGWYKPANGTCLMENLGLDYCAVCREAVTYTVLSLIDPIETLSPTNTDKVIVRSKPEVIEIGLLQPNPKTLKTEWRIDGKLIETKKSKIEIQANQISNKTGSKLTVTVFDTTAFIRTENPEIDIKHTRTWDLEVEKSNFTAKLATSSNISTICNGETVKLTANNCGGTLSWSTGEKVAVIEVKPNKTTTYVLNCLIGNKTDTAQTTVKVNPLPSALASNTGAYFEGATLELIGTGGGTYEWRGPANFNSTEASPKIFQAKLTNAGIYYLTVTKDNCIASTETTVFINRILAVNPTSKSDETIIYPNPIETSFKIDLSAFKRNQSAIIEIFDLTGKSVLKQERIEKIPEVNIQNLPSGSYLLKLSIEKKQLVYKLVKI